MTSNFATLADGHDGRKPIYEIQKKHTRGHMNSQDHAERACTTRDNRNTTQNDVLREAPTRINGVSTGEEPRDEHHTGFVSWAVGKTSIAIPAESRKGGVVN